MKPLKIIITVLAISVFVSCGKDEQATIPSQEAVTVTLKKAVQSSSAKSIVASGQVQASQSATLSTRMMGNVEKITVNVGDKVQKGQVLISLDAANVKAKLSQANASILQAEAQLKNVQTNFNRYQKLFEQESISQKELDDVTTQLSVAKAQLEAAEEMKNEVISQLKYAEIKAPFSGVVAAKFIKEGSLANPGQALMIIDNPNQFEVVASIAESEIASVKKNNQVMISIASVSEEFTGVVKEISSNAKSSGGTYSVTILLNETNEKIYAGMYAKVAIESATTSDSRSIFIDKSALIQKGQLHGIYTVSQNNTAILRWVKLGRSTANQVEIISGLTNGESYILSSEGKIYNGVPVTIK
jgi:RND family efflux transporter MFP subunit